MKKLALVVVLGLAGCQNEEEMNRLRGRIAQLENDNTKLRQNLPSEQPAILKELEKTKVEMNILRRELADAKALLSKGMPQELLPFAKAYSELKERVSHLEQTASRKGHTHEYADKGETFTTTKTTSGDK